jgi:hypothetical protein
VLICFSFLSGVTGIVVVAGGHEIMFRSDKALCWAVPDDMEGDRVLADLKGFCREHVGSLMDAIDNKYLRTLLSEAAYHRIGTTVATPIRNGFLTKLRTLALNVLEHAVAQALPDLEIRFSASELEQLLCGGVVAVEDGSSGVDVDDTRAAVIAEAARLVSTTIASLRVAFCSAAGVGIDRIVDAYNERASKERSFAQLLDLARQLEAQYRVVSGAHDWPGYSWSIEQHRIPRARQSASQVADKDVELYTELKGLWIDATGRPGEEFSLAELLLAAHGFRRSEFVLHAGCDVGKAVAAWVQRVREANPSLSVRDAAWLLRAGRRLLSSMVEFVDPPDAGRRREFAVISDGVSLKVAGRHPMEEDEILQRLDWQSDEELPPMVGTLGRVLRALDLFTLGEFGVLRHAVELVRLRRKLASLSPVELEAAKSATAGLPDSERATITNFTAASRIFDVGALFAGAVIHLQCARGAPFDLRAFGRWCLEQPVPSTASLYSSLASMAKDDRRLQGQLERELRDAHLLRKSFLWGLLPASIACAIFDEETLRAAGVHSVDFGMRNMFGAVHLHGESYDPWRVTGREFYHIAGHNHAEDSRVAAHEALQQKAASGAAPPSKKAPADLNAQLRFAVERGKDRHMMAVLKDMRGAADAANGDKRRDFVCIIGDSGFSGGHGHRQPGAKGGSLFLQEFILCIEMDEHLSSQRCPRCLAQSDFWKEGNYRVKCCHNCSGAGVDEQKAPSHSKGAKGGKGAQKRGASTAPFIFDRDTAAAVNFITILFFMCNNNGARPAEFCRSEIKVAPKAARFFESFSRGTKIPQKDEKK